MCKKSYNDISFHILKRIVSNKVTSETSSLGNSKALQATKARDRQKSGLLLLNQGPEGKSDDLICLSSVWRKHSSVTNLCILEEKKTFFVNKWRSACSSRPRRSQLLGLCKGGEKCQGLMENKLSEAA